MKNGKKEGRSLILICRSLSNMELQESTVQRVLSIIIAEGRKHGDEIAEEVATELMEMVDSSQTEEELLMKIDQSKYKHYTILYDVFFENCNKEV